MTGIIRKAVLQIVDAENQLASLRKRIDYLGSQKRENKIPTGLKIKSVKAKASAENTNALQSKFDEIIKEAENKLLDVSIENLRAEFAVAETNYEKQKEELAVTLARWRSTVQLKDENFRALANEYMEMAKDFADTLYFECIAEKTSKTLLHSLKVELEPSEQSIREMVKLGVARSFKSKLTLRRREKQLLSSRSSPKRVGLPVESLVLVLPIEGIVSQDPVQDLGLRTGK